MFVRDVLGGWLCWGCLLFELGADVIYVEILHCSDDLFQLGGGECFGLCEDDDAVLEHYECWN